jgi:hypothetical protein
MWHIMVHDMKAAQAIIIHATDCKGGSNRWAATPRTLYQEHTVKRTWEIEFSTSTMNNKSISHVAQL